jgi:CubicO group peptidase (beta-lactamase class C family)
MKNNTMVRILFAGICLNLSLGSCTYMARYVTLNFPDVNDYKKMPVRQIANDPEISFQFFKQERNPIARLLPYDYGERHIGNIDSFMLATESTAFIVIRNDSVLFENYYQGHSRETPCKVFSVSKNVISALIGIAIDEGFIKSEDDRVMEYVPEIKEKRLAGLTIRHCLLLASGIRSDNGEVFPWNDKVRVYYSRDIRKLLSRIGYESEPGSTFHAEEITPMLLGLVLERAIGRTISSYLEEKIWKPLGMDKGALWVIDSKRNGFEVVNSGLVATPMDMARFGRLYLKEGDWNGRSLISKDWIRSSTTPDTTSVAFWRSIAAYNGRDVYYKNTWWGLRENPEVFEYNASGHFGQRIVIVPSKNILLLRFGSGNGNTDWTGFMQDLASRL